MIERDCHACDGTAEVWDESGMRSRVLVGVAVVLIAAVVWIGQRDAGHSRAPIPSPEPERASSTRNAPELDRPDPVSIDSLEAGAVTPETMAAQTRATSRASAAETII